MWPIDELAKFSTILVDHPLAPPTLSPPPQNPTCLILCKKFDAKRKESITHNSFMKTRLERNLIMHRERNMM